MKRTKARWNRTKARWNHKILFRLCVVVVCTILFIGISPDNTYQADASVLSVYNHVTNDSFQYSGKQVVYRVEGKTLSAATPGLVLSNGAAVGPFDTVFKNKLGVRCDYVDGKNSFSVSFGPHVIKMTLGNTEASVNGKKQIMNNAPFVYSFDGSSQKYLYVPTRFVAETLGFDYIWNERTSTVSIRRSNMIYDGSEQLSYSGSTPAFVLNGTKVSSDAFPGYLFDNTVLFPAEECFKNTGMASYAYAEGSGLILFKNGTRMVRLVLDSPVAYINNDSYLLDTVPRLITPQNSSEAEVYVPAEFVAEALGFQAVYQENTETFQVTGTITEKKDSTATEASGTALPNPSSYGKSLFSYQTPEQIVSHYTGLGYRIPDLIAAYSCVNSDALYLKGIDPSQIKITDKNDIIEIVISGCYNPVNGKVSYNPDASFLNYCYISGTDTIKIMLIKTKELQYYTYSAPDGSVIHFTDILGMYQDYLDFTNSSDSTVNQDTDSDTTELLSGADITDYLPEAIFSREHFVIRLPQNIDLKKLTDTDEYSQKRFTISVPGNHMSYFSKQDTYNPVKTLSKVQFNYMASTDTTVITFYTTKIQGYSITIADGFLAVKIADPRKIYDKIIVLDAGHGGIDPGTLRGSVYEKTINYNVINVYAPQYFKDSDIKVYYTRTNDTKIALQTRADFAAAVGADLFISFHVNSHSNSAVNGTSVYYSASNNKKTASGLSSSILATSVVNCLSKAWGTRNRGILTDKFVVIHNNSVPAILIECGFITNNNDFNKIKDTAYQKKAAKALFDAVSGIFEQYPTNR